MPQVVGVEGRSRETHAFGCFIVIDQPLNLFKEGKCLRYEVGQSRAQESPIILRWLARREWRGRDCSATRSRCRRRQPRLPKRTSGCGPSARPSPGKLSKIRFHPIVIKRGTTQKIRDRASKWLTFSCQVAYRRRRSSCCSNEGVPVSVHALLDKKRTAASLRQLSGSHLKEKDRITCPFFRQQKGSNASS